MRREGIFRVAKKLNFCCTPFAKTPTVAQLVITMNDKPRRARGGEKIAAASVTALRKKFRAKWPRRSFGVKKRERNRKERKTR